MIITSEDHPLHPANTDYISMTNEEIKILMIDNGLDLSSASENDLNEFCNKLRIMREQDSLRQ